MRLKRAGLPNLTTLLGTKAADRVEARKTRDRLAASKRQLRSHEEEISTLREKVDLYESLPEPAPVPVPRRNSGGKRHGAFVVLASDWHIGETVDPIKVAGVNEYNPAVAKQRAERFFQGVVRLVDTHRATFDIPQIVMWFGGDLMTGHIHEELMEGNAMSPVEEVIWLRDTILSGINFVRSETGAQLIVPWDFGNHGRTTPGRRIATAGENSYEYMLGQILAKDVPELRVDLSKHTYVDVMHHTLHFCHGDDVRYGGGVGGLDVPLKKAIMGWDKVKRADYHHIGHFHQTGYGTNYITNGSLIGYGEYAYSIRANPEPPRQASYVLDAKRGRCMMTDIWV